MLTHTLQKSEREMKKYFEWHRFDTKHQSTHVCAVCVCLAKAKKEKKKWFFSRVQTSGKKKTNYFVKCDSMAYLHIYLPVFGVTAGWWSLLHCSPTLSDCVNWWENATNENREPNMNLRYDYKKKKKNKTERRHTHARALCWCYTTEQTWKFYHQLFYIIISSRRTSHIPLTYSTVNTHTHTWREFATDYLSSKIKLRSHFSFDVILITY